MIPTSMIKNITVLKFRGQNFRVLDFSEKNYDSYLYDKEYYGSEISRTKF